jgi:AraC-like DNA-binding protein
MRRNFWEVSIELEAYTFYEPRPDFISRDSVFSGWVMVIAERGEFEWKTKSRAGEMLHGKAALGDLVCASPKMPFWRRVTAKVLCYHVFQWSFVDANGRKADVLWPSGKTSIHDIARLQSTLELAKPLHGKMDAWSKRRKVHLLEELLHLAWQTQHEPSKITDAAMRDAAQLLRRRAGEVFSMREISAAFHLGPVQFTRRFYAAHGCNPIEFLTQARLEMAQRLLIETTLPLDEIAFRCGWSSGAYLSHVFHKQLCTTPGKFRASHRV